jgi:hypothetical protein
LFYGSHTLKDYQAKHRYEKDEYKKIAERKFDE